MPASLAPSYTDCRFDTQAAYRVFPQRAAVSAAAGQRARGPRGPAAMAYGRLQLQSLRRLAGRGSRPPGARNRLLPAFAYIHALIERNEGAADGGA